MANKFGDGKYFLPSPLKTRESSRSYASSVHAAMVQDMSGTFDSAYQFNSPIGDWDVSNVRVIEQHGKLSTVCLSVVPCAPVSRCENPVSVSSFVCGWMIQDTSNMFAVTSTFNQSIENWETGKVTTMHDMFAASVFNQPLDGWDVSSVVVRSYAPCACWLR